jgi:hypothetical protein
MPISKFSTLTEMKDYVRKHNLNKGEIRLNMKKSVMLGLLDKGGHIHTGPRSADAPKKKAPVKKTPMDKDLFMNVMSVMTDVAKSRDKPTTWQLSYPRNHEQSRYFGKDEYDNDIPLEMYIDDNVKLPNPLSTWSGYGTGALYGQMNNSFAQGLIKKFKLNTGDGYSLTKFG